MPWKFAGKMKILLIHPWYLSDRIDETDVSAIPIGLYYLAANLIENGHETYILNCWDRHGGQKALEDAIHKVSPDVLGVSIFHANRWGGIEAAQVARSINADIKIVFGGIGATFLWDSLLENFKEIDAVIKGEGEIPFSAFIDCLEKGTDYSSIPGLACRNNDGKPIANQVGPFIQDLSTLADPAQYFKFQHTALSRGCPHACNFCGSPGFWKRNVRFFTPEYFTNQLELLYRSGERFFYFSDDTFTLKKNLAIEVCRQIINKKLDISWQAICRVENIDDEIIKWMRKAGCGQISFGIESGSDKVRQLMGKKFSNNQVKRAFELTRKYGILPRAYFIYGSKGENSTAVDETVALIKEAKPLGAVFYMMTLFPGTKMWEESCASNSLPENMWLEETDDPGIDGPRIEDWPYFKTDPTMTLDSVIDAGDTIKEAFYENLHDFASAIDLVDDKEFKPLHADFLSKLAMTFDLGDYSKIPEIREKEKTAEFLYYRSLDYSHNIRAYLGLGILLQKQRNYTASITILEKGLEEFPKNQELSMCLGVSYMNMGNFTLALEVLECCVNVPDAENLIETCKEQLNMQKISPE